MENTLNSMFGTNVFNGLGGMVIVAGIVEVFAVYNKK